MREAWSIVVILCTIMLIGCKHSKQEGCLLPDTLRLQAGDVVFRRCTGLTSRMVMMSDRDGIFSHTGIVVDSAGAIRVVHAVPGELLHDGGPERVKIESVEQFFARGKAVAAGVARPVDIEAGRKAACYALRRYHEGTLFDHNYDDTDTARLYCTQLVVLSYKKAGIELVDTVREVIDLPSFHYRCILPSQVQQSKLLRFIYMFNPI